LATPARNQTAAASLPRTSLPSATYDTPAESRAAPRHKPSSGAPPLSKGEVAPNIERDALTPYPEMTVDVFGS